MYDFVFFFASEMGEDVGKSWVGFGDLMLSVIRMTKICDNSLCARLRSYSTWEVDQ